MQGKTIQLVLADVRFRYVWVVQGVRTLGGLIFRFPHDRKVTNIRTRGFYVWQFQNGNSII